MKANHNHDNWHDDFANDTTPVTSVHDESLCGIGGQSRAHTTASHEVLTSIFLHRSCIGIFECLTLESRAIDSVPDSFREIVLLVVAVLKMGFLFVFRV